MRANEWAKEFEGDRKPFRAFIEEIGVIASQRGGTRNAVEGAVREQRAKWRSVCRYQPGLDASSFDELLVQFGAEWKQVEDAMRKVNVTAEVLPVERPQPTTIDDSGKALPGRKLAAEAKRFNPKGAKS